MMTFLLFPALVLAFSLANGEMNYDFCETVFTSQTCVCPDRGNITLSPILEDYTRLTIKGCDTVTVTFGALSDLQLEELEFCDISTLHIHEFSFISSNGLNSFKFKNILNMIIETHAFVGVRDEDQLIFYNVTVNSLSKYDSIKLSNIGDLQIYNSVFNFVSLDLSFVNITSFHAYNSQFHSDEKSFISIGESSSIVFDNCSFVEAKDAKFAFSSAQSVYIDSCAFGELTSNFTQAKEVGMLSFRNCTFEDLPSDAFVDLEVKEKIGFINNTIKIAYPDSLTPFISHNYTYTEVQYCCNFFTCDCNMHWIWEYKNSHPNTTILENGFCLHDPTKDLSMYKPMLDSNNTCITIELASRLSALQTQHSELSTQGSVLPLEGFESIQSHAVVESLSFALGLVFCCLLVVELSKNIYIVN